MTPWRPLPLPSLAPERSASSVLQTLDNLSNGARNIRSAGPSYHPAMRRYMEWVSTAETQLRSVFAGEAAIDALHTRRYWFLLGLDSGAEPWTILHDELDRQASVLDQYASQLRHEINVFQLGENEQAVVLDTNFLLHFQQIDQIRWGKHMPGESHRLVIPAVVIKELDDKKYHATLRKRASNLIRFVYHLRGEEHPEVAVPLGSQPSVRVQIMLDPAGHQRAPSADDEILSRAEHLGSLVGGTLVVGTADYGMHLAASVRGLEAWWPDSSLRRDSDQAGVPTD